MSGDKPFVGIDPGGLSPSLAILQAASRIARPLPPQPVNPFFDLHSLIAGNIAPLDAFKQNYFERRDTPSAEDLCFGKSAFAAMRQCDGRVEMGMTLDMVDPETASLWIWGPKEEFTGFAVLPYLRERAERYYARELHPEERHGLIVEIGYHAPLRFVVRAIGETRFSNHRWSYGDPRDWRGRRVFSFEGYADWNVWQGLAMQDHWRPPPQSHYRPLKLRMESAMRYDY